MYGEDGDDFRALAVGNDRGLRRFGLGRHHRRVGRDVILGGAGPDLLVDGFHHDVINGGAGDDQLFGELPPDSPPPPVPSDA